MTSFKKGGIYLSLGSSTTWTGYNVNVLTGANLYCHRLWKYINANYAPIKLINKGIGGTDTNKMLINQYWLYRNLVPDLVTIGVGLNDCANNSIPTATYKANLGIIIDGLRERNPDVVIILCSPNRTSEATRVNNVAAYRTAMSEIAETKNVSYCDFGTAWTQSSGDMAINITDPSGIHPNGVGHGAMYNVLLPVVLNSAADWLNSLGS